MQDFILRTTFVIPAVWVHFILAPFQHRWQAPVANFNAVMSDDLKKFIEQEDITLIGYRQISDAMRNG